jgi:hypothetical protein
MGSWLRCICGGVIHTSLSRLNRYTSFYFLLDKYSTLGYTNVHIPLI